MSHTAVLTIAILRTASESITHMRLMEGIPLQTIRVKHNFESAHRLSLLPGKCQNIHGHSFWAELEIGGDVDATGVLLEFSEVKKWFRNHLDSTFDHQLLFNRTDADFGFLPGVTYFPGDPTTENLARWIGEDARDKFGLQFHYRVVLQETSVNFATWEG